MMTIHFLMLVCCAIPSTSAEKEWGDGVHGLSLQAARYALLKLEEGPLHTKNWRPQILILCKLDSNLIPAQPKTLSFASQLKAGQLHANSLNICVHMYVYLSIGKGLMIIHSVLEGSYTKLSAECTAAKQSLKRFSDNNKIEGFVQVVASRTALDGLTNM